MADDTDARIAKAHESIVRILTDTVRPHYDGCYRDQRHHNCAVREVERLRGVFSQNLDLQIEIERLRWFAGKVAQEYRTAGPEVEEWGVVAGVMVQVRATEPCGEACVCAEMDNLPGECYRLAPDIAATLDHPAP